MDSQKSPEVVEMNSNIEDINHLQLVPITKSKTNSQKNILVDCTSPQITADQYASRSAMLSSTVSAWSPLLQFSSDSGQVSSNSSSECCSLLAFGGKSGKISIWRINGPEGYSVEQSKGKNVATLVGLLAAHAAWITTISWAVLASEVSNPQFLLAAGSSDGSVKIWRVSSDELLKSSELNHAYFLLVNEVSSVGAIPVSVLSLAVPIELQQKILLAIGRVSGSFDVWSCDLSTGKLDIVSSDDAHDHVVTGLAWAFDGTCLYSCSQDNTVRSWILHESSLYEAPFHSSTLGVKTSTDIPISSDSCFGVDASPGNLVIAVVRKFDVECLHPMYQARTMKAAVEFFWIGGQQSGLELNSNPEIGIENFPGFSENELVYWESNILRSLSNYERADRPLVVWDIIAALLAFKVSAPKYVEQILLRWLSMSFVESDFGLPTEQVLSHTSRSFPKVSSRRLQLVNVICRRLMLPEFKTDQPNRKQPDLGHCGAKEELMTSWMELISSCERELRERVVGFNMSAAFCHFSCSASTVSKIRYYPCGIAQMKQWIDLNHDDVQDKQKYYAGKHVARLQTARGYVEEEKCYYCSASVPFESPEVAFCQGVNGQRHKFVRCAVSMRACPPTPLWFCTCCKRWAWQLAPEALFAMPEHPSDFESYLEHSNMSAFSKPLCPFCGVLLQRSQPEFLLSASPV